LSPDMNEAQTSGDMTSEPLAGTFAPSVSFSAALDAGTAVNFVWPRKREDVVERTPGWSAIVRGNEMDCEVDEEPLGLKPGE
jgi:hypothetical protein